MERWASLPIYSKGINAGPGPPLTLPDAPPEFADHRGRVDTPATRRQAFVTRMGRAWFEKLCARIEAVHACAGLGAEHPSEIIPPQAVGLINGTVRSECPYTPKHAVQQASIVGNMAAQGLLRDAKDTVYVEFGAGKGYLTCMLADCYPEASSLVMMDVRGFKLVADRRLRHTAMQRLRCDIADFVPSGIQGLDPGAPWVAFGKHLCGPATDFTLRCAAKYHGRGLRGVAVATCCHHVCTWQHYVGQDVFRELGFSPEEFEVMSYMCGWATCGHDGVRPTDLEPDTKEGKLTVKEGHAATSMERVAAEAREVANGREAGEDDGDEETNGGSWPVRDGGASNGSNGSSGDGDLINSPNEVHADEGGINGSNRAHAAPLPSAVGLLWRPYHTLSRAERMKLGAKCKQLIDYGRAEWMRRAHFQAEIMQYVDPEVSGENKLLMAVPMAVRTASGTGAEVPLDERAAGDDVT